MPRFGRPGKPRHVHQRGEAGMLTPAHDDEPLGHEGAIEPLERHHIGDGAERREVGEIEQIGLRPRRRPEIARPQFAADRDQGEKRDPDGGQVAEPRKIIEPVRIDHRHGGRQLLVGLMMVDDDDIEAEPCGFRQRLVAGGAAVDRDQEPGAALGERTDRRHVRPIAFENAIRNVDQRLDARAPEKRAQQGGRGRAVDIVVAEDRYRLVAHDGVGDAPGGRVHRGDAARIRHQRLDGRVEKGFDLVRLDAAARDDAGEQLRQSVALHDRQRAQASALVEPVAPHAAGCRLFDAEKNAADRFGVHEGDQSSRRRRATPA